MELPVVPRRPIDLDPLQRILEERYRPQDHQEAQELIVGACQEAQHLYGWVPPQAAHLIAEHLGVTINRVYGLLTFYADFRTQPLDDITFGSVMGRRAMSRVRNA